MSQNPSKIASKIDEKIDAENVLKIHENFLQSGAKIDAETYEKRMRFRNPSFLVFCREYNVKIVFLHDWGSEIP